MDLKTFLLARVAEDEATVADPLEWERVGGYRYVDGGGLNEILTVGTDRVLAECAAKQAIVELADGALAAEVKRRDASALGANLMHQDTLRALAAVYADHEDYQPEWKLAE